VGKISKKTVTLVTFWLLFGDLGYQMVTLVTLVTKIFTDPNFPWLNHYRRHFFGVFLEKNINKSNLVLLVIAIMADSINLRIV